MSWSCPLFDSCMNEWDMLGIHMNNFQYCFSLAENDRIMYMESLTLERACLPFKITRNTVFDDVVTLYKNQGSEVLQYYPFRVQFLGERAIDIGGVARDMFSAFFEMAYKKLFDGCSLLSPVVHPGMDVSTLKVIGFVISHAYLVTGLLPVQIAFPCLSLSLLGTSVTVSKSILLDSFVKSISIHEAGLVNQALTEIKSGASVFSATVMNGIVLLFSRFNVRELPTPEKFQDMLMNVAHYEFIAKPSSALSIINSGIPSQHIAFWESINLTYLLSVYQAQCVSSTMVLKMFDDAEGENETEERVIGYVRQFIGNMSSDELAIFLRFATGSAVCSSSQVGVIFNKTSGISRRPIAHTCSPSLELSTTYISYSEFVSEFKACIISEYSWTMDSI